MPSQPAHTFTYGVLTISDGASRGYRIDTSGQLIDETLTQQGLHLRHREVVPDDVALITGWLRRWAPHVDLIVTTGGTGLGPRDVTPEATMRAIERPVPGLAEALRDETRRKTPLAALSRGVAGILGRCLIVNLPGSPKAVGGVPGGPAAGAAARAGHGPGRHLPPPLAGDRHTPRPPLVGTPMDIHVLSLFPSVFSGPLEASILKRAQEREALRVRCTTSGSSRRTGTAPRTTTPSAAARAW